MPIRRIVETLLAEELCGVLLFTLIITASKHFVSRLFYILYLIHVQLCRARDCVGVGVCRRDDRSTLYFVSSSLYIIGSI